MKYTFLFFLTTICTSLFSQRNAEIRLSPPVSEVKIHLTNAEIIHKQSINLSAGKTKVVVTGLSPKINLRSVRADLNENISILSISGNTNFLQNQIDNPATKRVRDSLVLIGAQIQDFSDRIDALVEEKSLLLANKSIGGVNTGLVAAELTRTAELYRTRLLEINRSISELNVSKKNLNLILYDLNNQLNVLNARRQPTAQIELELDTKTAQKDYLVLHYVVDNAGWSPIYDLRSQEIGKSVNLNYRALAYNNTGIDWNYVKISLSTADPLKSAAQPILRPWIMNYDQQQDILSQEAELGYFNDAVVNDKNRMKEEDKSEASKPAPTGAFKAIEISELSTDFDIKEPYTIPSDDKPYSIDIANYELPASFKHFSAPKLDRDPFLLAQITGWEKLDLITGPVNVYNDGKYVGKSELNTRSLSDTLSLSLGRDQKVLVTRIKKDEMNSRQTFGPTRKVLLDFEISIKNNHNSPIDIDLFDQIPISENKEITVNVEELSNAALDPSTGETKWSFHLGAGEKRTVRLAFSIKFPKNRKVRLENKENSKTMAPRYF